MEKTVDGNVISVPVVDLRVELIFFVIPNDGDDWILTFLSLLLFHENIP